MLAIETVLLGLLGLILGLIAAFYPVGWYFQRQCEREEQCYRDELSRISRWRCADCQNVFADNVMAVFCGSPCRRREDHVEIIAGRPFVRHAVIVCGHCRRLRAYDRHGEPWALPGTTYTDQFVPNSSR